MALGETLQKNCHNNLLCKNGCGFYGTRENQGYCSACYKRIMGEDPPIAKANPDESADQFFPLPNRSRPRVESDYEFGSRSQTSRERSLSPSIVRCGVCNKRLTLADQGMVCACGGVFCAAHRFADHHNCTFDYKTEGREQLRKANPRVVGEKVKKI